MERSVPEFGRPKRGSSERVRSIDLTDHLRLWMLEPPEATAFRDGGPTPPLRARSRPTNIQVVNEYTVATFLLTTGPEDEWLTHVRFDRSPDSQGVALVSWETAPGAQRHGYAKTAVSAAVDWMCAEHELRYITAWIRAGQLESEATARSVGFRTVSSAGNGRTWRKDCGQQL